MVIFVEIIEEGVKEMYVPPVESVLTNITWKRCEIGYK